MDTTGNSARYQVPSNWKTLLMICLVLGVAAFGIAAYVNPERAWPSFLINFFFFLTLSIFGVFFTALQHATNAYWSVTVRRLAEGLASYLPVALLLGVVLLLGKNHLYEWLAPGAAKDEIIAGKAPYLNSQFFGLRVILFIALWSVVGWKLTSNSLRQDKEGGAKFSLSNIKISMGFIPVFAVTFTLLSFDLLMSLSPKWFSTIFGIYCFSGMFFSGMATMAILVIIGSKQGAFSSKLINENHLHDIAQLMITFTVFWTYIMFSQLMLQWYANLPEEIPYYYLRLYSNWGYVSAALLLVHFILPFFLLLPRETKRSSKKLLRIAILMLGAHWLDIYYMVMPTFFKKGPVFGWIEVGTFLGFAGIFGLTVLRFLERVPSTPQRDPRLAQCLAHTQ